jgi:Fur family peroxide stress response transcriptional regulator
MKSTSGLTAQEKQRRLEEFKLHCRENGMPFTAQRRVILQAVLDLDTHPTADAVYSLPSVRHARISRATVYRALESLVQSGAITKACHPGGKVRYDGRTEIHHHLICLRCDSVMDISSEKLNALQIPDTSAFGFDVKDFRVQLRGLCRQCRRMEDKL